MNELKDNGDKMRTEKNCRRELDRINASIERWKLGYEAGGTNFKEMQTLINRKKELESLLDSMEHLHTVDVEWLFKKYMSISHKCTVGTRNPDLIFALLYIKEKLKEAIRISRPEKAEKRVIEGDL